MNYCFLCDVSCTGARSYESHLVGAKHKRKEKLKKLEETKAAAAKLAAKLAPPKKVVPIIRKDGEELASMAMHEVLESSNNSSNN